MDGVADVTSYQKKKKKVLPYSNTNSFVPSPPLRLRQAKQAKMASEKLDVRGHVLTALPAAGFGSDSRGVEGGNVCMCVYVRACVF